METLRETLENFIAREQLLELRRRLVPGSIGHIGILTILLAFTHVVSEHPLASLIFGSGIVLPCLLRISQARMSPAQIAQTAKEWKFIVHLYIHTTMISWAGLFFFILRNHSVTTLDTILVCLIAAGNTANATSALSCDKWLARTSVIGYIGAIIAGMIHQGGTEALSIILISIGHLGYHTVQIGLHSDNFRDSKEREYRLIQLKRERENYGVLLRGILNSIEDAIFLKDSEGVLQMVNHAGERLLDIKADDVIGHNIYEFQAKEHRDHFKEVDRKVRDQGIVQREELEMTVQGERRTIARSSFPYYDTNGMAIGVLTIGKDVTAIKMEKSRLSRIIHMQHQISGSGGARNLQSVMDMICLETMAMKRCDGAFIQVVDGDSFILKAASGPLTNFRNYRAKRVGCIADQVLRYHMTMVCHDTESDERINVENARILGIRSMIVSPLRFGENLVGNLICYSSVPSFFHEEHSQTMQVMSGMIASILSQTVEFEEKEVAISNLKESEKSLIQARAVAEDAAQAKADFLASMSHEIRTPLNGIIGMTELLIDTPLSEQQKHFARIVQNSGNGLLAIINDILDFSKIDAGKMEFEITEFEPVFLLESQAELMAVKSNEKGLSLMTFIDPKIPPNLVGDSGRISQIILNLLSNSIKFTSKGSVTASALLLESDGETANIFWEVTDTGIGIAPEVQRKLFAPFTQADGSTARRYGGTGLGLSISKRLVELMNGTIGIDSIEGQGATFWFTTPLPIGKTKTLETEPSLKGKRILVVDDDSFARETLGAYLREWEAEGLTVANAALGLENLRQAQRDQQPFDLVVIDRYMKGLDGLELAREIRAESTLAATKLVLITAFDGPFSPEAYDQALFNAYLRKPIKKSDFRHALEDQLNLRPKDGDGESLRSLSFIQEPLVDHPMRILLVEDNPVNQMLAIHQLNKMGLSCQIAANGREALDAFASLPFDIILMDCQMPEMDGYEATRRIREMEQGTGRRTPIMAMTANALNDDEKRCRAVGMDDFLPKPISRKNLEIKLRYWLKGLKQNDVTSVDRIASPSLVDASLYVVDWPQLMHNYENDKFAISLVIDAFIVSAPDSLRGVREAIATKDSHALAHAAHTLKGAVLNFGTGEVSQICQSLENEGHEGIVNDSSAIQLAQLETAMQRLMEELVREAPKYRMAG